MSERSSVRSAVHERSALHTAFNPSGQSKFEAKLMSVSVLFVERPRASWRIPAGVWRSEPSTLFDRSRAVSAVEVENMRASPAASSYCCPTLLPRSTSRCSVVLRSMSSQSAYRPTDWS